jgi:hypothetical protein
VNAAEIMRRLASAAQTGSSDAYWSLHAADFVAHIPGQSRVGGDYRGHGALQALDDLENDLTEGSIEHEVHDTRVRCVTPFRPPSPPFTLVSVPHARVAEPGRRAGLRIRCPKGRGGSNPPSRTALLQRGACGGRRWPFARIAPAWTSGETRSPGPHEGRATRSSIGWGPSRSGAVGSSSLSGCWCSSR